LILVGLGFSLHAFLDGVGLQQEVLDGVSSIVGDVSLEGNHNHDGAPQANSAIVLAVLAHRIPIGLFLGFAAIRKRSLAYTFAFIISMSTIGGYFLGAVIPASGAIQALLGGALLHVITGHSFIETLSEKAWSVRVIGAIGGGVLLLLMNDTHAHSSLFLEIWSLGSLLLLVVMALQLPRHHCIACEDPEIS
jgi:hypothetical protein